MKRITGNQVLMNKSGNDNGISLVKQTARRTQYMH